MFYESAQRTGVFWAEAAHPYDVLTKEGFSVDVASETGQARVDEQSVDKDMLKYSQSTHSWANKDHPMHCILESGVKAAATVKSTDYDGVFFSAGHGAMYDFPQAQQLAQVAVQMYTQGKPVAAVCHGPAIFNATTDINGQSIAHGKRITGFAWAGEEEKGWDKQLEKDGVGSCESIAKKIGAIWDEPKEPWGDYTAADGLILTGVNPASSQSLARNLVKAIQATKS